MANYRVKVLRSLAINGHTYEPSSEGDGTVITMPADDAELYAKGSETNPAFVEILSKNADIEDARANLKAQQDAIAQQEKDLAADEKRRAEEAKTASASAPAQPRSATGPTVTGPAGGEATDEKRRR